MKKLANSVAIFTLLCISFTAHASLTANADGTLVYDNDLNITWIADADYSKNSGFNNSGVMNWYDATNNWASSLTVAGENGWRLPTLSEMQHLYFQELGGSFNVTFSSNHNKYYDLFQNFHSTNYWTSTEDPNNAGNAAVFSLYDGHKYFRAGEIKWCPSDGRSYRQFNYCSS